MSSKIDPPQSQCLDIRSLYDDLPSEEKCEVNPLGEISK